MYIIQAYLCIALMHPFEKYFLAKYDLDYYYSISFVDYSNIRKIMSKMIAKPVWNKIILFCSVFMFLCWQLYRSDIYAWISIITFISDFSFSKLQVVSLICYCFAFILLFWFLYVIYFNASVNKATNLNISNSGLEFLTIVILGSCFGAASLLSSNFISFYVALEGLSLATFLSISRHSLRAGSKELFFKYFCFSSFSSVLLAAGISFLYLLTQSLEFAAIKLFLFFHKISMSTIGVEDVAASFTQQLLFVSLWLILLSFLFKVGSYPFQFIVPDIYEASSLLFLFFYNFIIKVFYLLVLAMLVTFLFSDWHYVSTPILIASGFGSIVVGTFSAYMQWNFWRFLGYASIAQTGLVLLGLSTLKINSIAVTFAFFGGYLGATLLIFLALLYLFITDPGLSNSVGHGYLEIFKTFKFDKFIASKTTLISLVFVIAFSSFAALPPFLGFITKYLLLLQFIKYDTCLLALSVVLLNMVSTYYYLRLIERLADSIKTQSKNYKSLFKQSTSLVWTTVSNWHPVYDVPFLTQVAGPQVLYTLAVISSFCFLLFPFLLNKVLLFLNIFSLTFFL